MYRFVSYSSDIIIREIPNQTWWRNSVLMNFFKFPFIIISRTYRLVGRLVFPTFVGSCTGSKVLSQVNWPLSEAFCTLCSCFIQSLLYGYNNT